MATTERRLLTWADLLELTGVTRDTIYRWQRDRGFPKPVLLGERVSRWLEPEVWEWIEAQERGGASIEGGDEAA